MDKIQEYYKNSIIANLCSEYKGMWQSAHGDKLELLKLSLCQQAIPHVVTFAYNGTGITKDYVEKEFADYINGYTVHNADGVSGYTYGLFVDYDYDNDLVADKDVCSIMWTVGASVLVPKTKCPTLYVSNRSNVHLVCDGFNSVKVYLFDKSTITIEDADENCTITVYQYSDDSTVEIGKYCLTEKVNIFKKQLKL